MITSLHTEVCSVSASFTTLTAEPRKDPAPLIADGHFSVLDKLRYASFPVRWLRRSRFASFPTQPMVQASSARQLRMRPTVTVQQGSSCVLATSLLAETGPRLRLSSLTGQWAEGKKHCGSACRRRIKRLQDSTNGSMSASSGSRWR